ncbi:hypothetical protein AMAG_12592 [Allomyces macrogynus ATCC 38327]|uniref:Uncharacterized protein n=2 Tax=Allomyces macrogynus (strain ATCC 38327) TaxID=578462 RepID=A0A0L0SZN1_ALLM3|nr:hypothetical protein AMAG_12592 [Allomyces macrogynus ATCC 38327]|eukprot:KNE67875.1 hypothetical protein AMAG_12592 [Allomyces macrogynus ATCC 38327]
MAATAAPAPTFVPAAPVATPAAAGAAPTVAQEQAPSYAQLREMLAGGMACSVAAAVTNPMDVVKIRMQVQRAEAHEAHLGVSAIKYRGFYQSMTKIVAEEGLLGLILPGMAACLIREFSYSGIRFGLYSHVKELYGVGKGNDGDVGLLAKLAAGSTTGAIGSCLANPTDLIKIRQQAEAGRLVNGIYTTGLRAGHPPTYRNLVHAVVHIGRTEGLPGLYKGVSATAIRASLLTAGQMASYDHTKYLLRTKYRVMNEGPALHVTASIVAGLCACTMAAPADLIKSRIMADPQHLHYRNVLDCFVQTVKHDGVRTLFKGWLPSYFRLAPHFIISLPLFEQFRVLLGLHEM